MHSQTSDSLTFSCTLYILDSFRWSMIFIIQSPVHPAKFWNIVLLSIPDNMMMVEVSIMHSYLTEKI